MARQTQRGMMYLLAFGALIGVAAAAWAMWTPPGPRAGRLPTVVSAPPAAVDSAPSSLAPLPPVERPVARPKPVRRARRSPRRGRTLSPVMQAALAAPDDTEHIVMDVAAVRDSAMGQAILNCMPQGDSTELTRLKRDAGFDPIQQVQRFGFAGDVAVIEGDFGAVDWLGINDELTLERQADGVDVYTNGFREFAVIEGKHLVAGRPEQVKAALQRIEDGVVEGAPTLRGAVSGRVPLSELFTMLPVSSDVRKSMTGLLAAQGGIDLNIDVNDDGAQFDFALEQVDPMLKEAIKAGVEAVKGGAVHESARETLAPLIDGITVDDSDDALRIRTPVTMAFLEHALGDCVHGDRPVD